MSISEGMTVSLHYTVYDEDARPIDTSGENEPWTFIYGAGQMLEGVEKALLGHVVGDSMELELSPEDAYGERDIALTSYADISQFPPEQKLEEGMPLYTEVDGEMVLATVKEVKTDKVLLDLNHPFAGKHLKFQLEVVDVQDMRS